MARRGIALTVAILVIALGIVLDRVLTTSIPIGGVLYAVLIYLLVVVVRPRSLRASAAVIALALCAIVEVAQLTGVPAAMVTAFPPARFVLGTSFDPLDLVAYAVGVAIALVVDRLLDAYSRRATRAS